MRMRRKMMMMMMMRRRRRRRKRRRGRMALILRELMVCTRIRDSDRKFGPGDDLPANQRLRLAGNTKIIRA